MSQLWNEPSFRGGLDELETKLFTLLQSVSTKAYLAMQRKQLKDDLSELSARDRMLRVLGMVLVIIVTVEAMICTVMHLFNYQTTVSMVVLIAGILGVIFIVIFTESKIEERETVLFNLNPISENGQLCLEANELCDQSASANQWRKEAVRARGDILVGDLMIMRKLGKLEVEQTKASEGVSKYQALLSLD